MDPNGAVALGAVVGGLELVRYYLAEDYSRLRSLLAAAAGGEEGGSSGPPPLPGQHPPYR